MSPLFKRHKTRKEERGIISPCCGKLLRLFQKCIGEKLTITDFCSESVFIIFAFCPWFFFCKQAGVSQAVSNISNSLKANKHSDDVENARWWRRIKSQRFSKVLPQINQSHFFFLLAWGGGRLLTGRWISEFLWVDLQFSSLSQYCYHRSFHFCAPAPF